MCPPTLRLCWPCWIERLAVSPQDLWVNGYGQAMQSSPPRRFTTAAASALRAAIAEAGGVEVFALGRLDADGDVADIEILCRGNMGAVPALRTRPRSGQAVIHNHPSGILQASEADMGLAHLYGEDGVGVAIVNNEVNGVLWVVEPHRRSRQPVDPAKLDHIFEKDLPRVLPGFEPRPAQVAMAQKVLEMLNEGSDFEGHLAALEAGTGTGKSLAYLLPAALWALATLID